MAYNEIERLFNDDIREKKKAGRGAFAKTGKGNERAGVKGGLKTPYSFMTTRERKKLNGEVRITQMYETIISREEFELKDKETQKAMLTRWREIYPNGKIMDDMGVRSSGAFHNIIQSLEIPRKTRHGAGRPRGEGTSPKPKIKKELATVEQAPETTPIVNFVQQAPVKLITNGLHLEYNGIFSSEQINKIFTKLQLLVDGEENDFNIELRITESEKIKDKTEGQQSLDL
jgi:hypothetical protein